MIPRGCKCPVCDQLPSGRHGLSSQYVAEHQRERLLRAICERCAEHGFQQTTVADIARAARVSTRVFYANFASKQECLLAAFDARVNALRAAALGVVESDDPLERIAAGVRVLLTELAADPVSAHLLLVDVLYAGDVALCRREQVLASCAGLLPLARGVPSQAAEAALGGVVEIVRREIICGRCSQLPALAGELTYCLLVTLVGTKRAVTV